MKPTIHLPHSTRYQLCLPTQRKWSSIIGMDITASHSLLKQAGGATTFITEWGRYQYLRAPMGFQASGDAYTKCFNDITVDMKCKTSIIDDTILWDSSISSAFWHTLEYISHCAQNGIVFNPAKFAFGKTKVDFGGFTLTKDGIKPTNSMISAIANFPANTH